MAEVLWSLAAVLVAVAIVVIGNCCDKRRRHKRRPEFHYSVGPVGPKGKE